MDVSMIGLDIAKSVFQVHGVDAAGEAVERKRLARARVGLLVSRSSCPASWRWRRAAGRITGRAS